MPKRYPNIWLSQILLLHASSIPVFYFLPGSFKQFLIDWDNFGIPCAKSVWFNDYIWKIQLCLIDLSGTLWFKYRGNYESDTVHITVHVFYFFLCKRRPKQSSSIIITVSCWGPFFWHGLPGIRAWVCNYINSFTWGVITHPWSNFNVSLRISVSQSAWRKGQSRVP